MLSEDQLSWKRCASPAEQYIYGAEGCDQLGDTEGGRPGTTSHSFSSLMWDALPIDLAKPSLPTRGVHGERARRDDGFECATRTSVLHLSPQKYKSEPSRGMPTTAQRCCTKLNVFFRGKCQKVENHDVIELGNLGSHVVDSFACNGRYIPISASIDSVVAFAAFCLTFASVSKERTDLFDKQSSSKMDQRCQNR